MKFETSKVKVRTGPVNPYYLRLRQRRLTFRQRLRLLFGGTLTTFVEMDSDGAGPYRAQGYLHGDNLSVELAHGDDWEALAPGGLLSPWQAERFLRIMCGTSMLEDDPCFEDAFCDAVTRQAAKELEKEIIEEVDDA